MRTVPVTKFVAAFLFAAVVLPSTAWAYLVTTAGVTLALGPSADTLTLSPNAVTTAGGLFNLQPGVFFVGDSGNLSGTYPYTFTEMITIDGQTKAVPISIQLIVTNPTQANTDTLTIFASALPVAFGGPGVALTIQPYASPGLFSGQSVNFTLTASLARSVPEPMTWALGGVGLLGLALSRRRKAAGRVLVA